MAINGTYNSVWDGGYVITTNCSINLATGVVTPELASEAESADVDVLDREYVEVVGQVFGVYEQSGEYLICSADRPRLKQLALDSLTKHSKGPYSYEDGFIFGADKAAIAEIYGKPVLADANGQLLAASHSLLSALVDIEGLLASHPEASKGNSKVHFAMHKARAAISLVAPDAVN